MLKTFLLASALIATVSGFALANYQKGATDYNEGRYVSAYNEFKTSASSGHAAAQYMLGRLYQEGRGVDSDVVQAYAWYDVSAMSGYGPAGAARDALAPSLTASQLQSATALAAQWRGGMALSDSGPTAPPAAAAAPYSVASVQTALNQLGYAAGTADGAVGPKTRAAIRAYQTDSGLPASGEPSVALYDHLKATVAGQTATTQPAVPTGPSATLVSEVQGELRLRGYDVPSVTGTLDAVTVAAIKRYQADASLAVDGKVSDTLLTQLRSGRTDPGVDYRAQVKSVQQALNTKGYDAGPADGALGPRSRGAIRAYQIANNLPVTGAVDAVLMQSLGVATASTPTAASTGTALNSSIETALVKHGYAAGRIDGVLDEQARSAIAQFQKDSGMAVTGQASQTLLDTLASSSKMNDSGTLSQLVWQVEEQLKVQGYRVGALDGTLDEETRKGIEDYQKDADLKVNGKVSTKLLASLQAAGTPGAGQEGLNLLTPREVWEVEIRLDARGYDTGTVDKVADANTYAAVVAFQRDQGLPITGRMDEALLLQLQQSAEASPNNSAGLSTRDQGLLLVQGILNTMVTPRSQ